MFIRQHPLSGFAQLFSGNRQLSNLLHQHADDQFERRPFLGALIGGYAKFAQFSDNVCWRVAGHCYLRHSLAHVSLCARISRAVASVSESDFDTNIGAETRQKSGLLTDGAQPAAEHVMQARMINLLTTCL
jgi:hypothetical protein